MTLKKVAVIGGNGTLGPHILQALNDAKVFEVAVISRASSKSSYPSGVQDLRVPDSMEKNDLVSALQGQDALVIAIDASSPELHIKFVEAAHEAGVKRVIPADFGSCDSSDPRSLALAKLYRDKKEVRDHLIQLAESQSSDQEFSWTALITGHFLDWGLTSGLMAMDIKARTARIYDNGEIRISATTLPNIGFATAQVLQNEAATKNKLLYVQSVSFTQNELLMTVEKVVGETFQREEIDSEAFIKDRQQKLKDKGGKDHDLLEDLVGVEGVVNAFWEDRDSFSNELLGMPTNNLEDIVKTALA